MLSLRRLLLVLVFFAPSAWATTRTATDCSAAAIQAQVNLSTDGDTVLVPTGQSITWTTTSLLTINVGITLNGQGCVITFPSSGAEIVVNADNVTNTFITGFTFNGCYSQSSADGPIHLIGGTVAAPAKPFRFFNNLINTDVGGITGGNVQCVYIQGQPGLFDHNVITGQQTGETVWVYGTAGGFDDSLWTADVTPGGSNMIFLEDNTVCHGTWTGSVSSGSCAITTTSNVVQGFIGSYHSAIWVARHNHLFFANYDAHTTNPSSYFGVRWVEGYQNDITLPASTVACWSALVEVRGGSGVFWGNTDHSGAANCANPAPTISLGPTGSDLQTGTWPLARQLGRGIESPTNTFGNSPFYAWGNDSKIHTFSIFPGYVQVGSTQTSSSCTAQSTGHPANFCDGVDFGSTVTNPSQTLLRCETAQDVATGCPVSYTYVNFTYPHPLQSNNPQAGTPTAIPAGGTFQRWQSVSLSTPTSGAIICFATNGTVPVIGGASICPAGSTKYATPISISQSGNTSATTTLIAVAGGPSLTDSSAASNTYTIQGDKYGGRLDILCATTTAYFHLEKINQRWFFCTPQGHGFISMNVANVVTNGPGNTPDCANVNTVPIYTAKYGDTTFNWSWQTNKRIVQWGFNTLGQDTGAQPLPGATCVGCVWPGGKQPIQLPYITESKPAENASINVSNFISEPIKNLIEASDGHFTSPRQGATYDVFDPKLSQWWNAALATNTALKNNDPFLIGIFTDDSDFFWGGGAGPDYITGHTNTNVAWTTLISSPVMTYANATSFGGNSPAHKFIYNIQQNFSKTQALNPATCSIASPCSLRDYLKLKYTTIAALNASWGSNYTTFDSSATQVTGEIPGSCTHSCVGDGSTTSFTMTLAHPPDPLSVLFLIAGTAQMGDCPWFYATNNGNCITTTANTGTLGSPSTINTQSTSTINYTTGAVTINFVTAPALNATITVNYQWGGWGQGGTGLMDENGSNTAWVGTNPVCLEGANPSYPTYFSCVGGGGNNNPVPNANPNLGADLDNYVSQFAAQYFKTMQTDLRAVSHIPYLGLDLVGSWSAPAYSKFLQGNAPYVDALMTDMHWFLPLPSPTVFQNQYQYNTQYLGDIPIINYGNGGEAQSDSGYSCKPGDVNTVASQPVRGQNYQNAVNYLLTTPSFNGDFPVVGFDHWAWQDFQNLNQGLVDVHDNAYDGIEATTASVPCANYYTSLTNCGGEPAGFNAPYGNYTTPVTAANQIWLSVTSGSGAPLTAFNPTSFAFPATIVNQTAGPNGITLQNTGTAPLLITSITIVGTNQADFSQTNTCPASLAVNATCTISASFTPSAVGARSANISVVDNAAGSPQSVPLSGTGTAPIATVSPGSLVFGGVVVNQSQNQNVTLQNTGNAALTITSIVQTGTGFTQTNNCPASLGAGLSCIIQVNFAPIATGTSSGTLTITDNSFNGSPQTVGATGSGILVPSTSTGVIIQGSVQQ